MLLTLTAHFLTEYKKAESLVNTRIPDPDVLAIISAATIIKWFAFKYFIHFTIMGSRVQGSCFQNRFVFLFKENTWPSGSRIFLSFNVLFIFLFFT